MPWTLEVGTALVATVPAVIGLLLLRQGLDGRATTADVAEASAPTYDSHGNAVAAWQIVIDYDPLRDLLSVRWRQEAGPYHRAKTDASTYDVQDLEDLLADVQRAVRILGARRLF